MHVSIGSAQSGTCCASPMEVPYPDHVVRLQGRCPIQIMLCVSNGGTLSGSCCASPIEVPYPDHVMRLQWCPTGWFCPSPTELAYSEHVVHLLWCPIRITMCVSNGGTLSGSCRASPMVPYPDNCVRVQRTCPIQNILDVSIEDVSSKSFCLLL